MKNSKQIPSPTLGMQAQFRIGQRIKVIFMPYMRDQVMPQHATVKFVNEESIDVIFDKNIIGELSGADKSLTFGVDTFIPLDMYEVRVEQLEFEGCTTSDAQGFADVEQTRNLLEIEAKKFTDKFGYFYM